jgi:hypothetical protein
MCVCVCVLRFVSLYEANIISAQWKKMKAEGGLEYRHYTELQKKDQKRHKDELDAYQHFFWSRPHHIQDVWQSVFAFCDLATLHVLLSVSHEWKQWVKTTPSIAQAITATTSEYIMIICASDLSVHVGSIRPSVDEENNILNVHPACLLVLTTYCPNLQVLECTLMPSRAPPSFPANLQELDLNFPWDDPEDDDTDVLATQFHTTLRAMHQCKLEKLTLRGWNRAYSVSALASLKHLTYLRLTSSTIIWTDNLIREIRALSGPIELDLNIFTPSIAKKLLATPHALEWTGLTCVDEFNETMAALFTTLHGLTGLDIFYLAMPHIDFAMDMPHLTSLCLGTADTHTQFDVQRIFDTLSRLVNLKKLHIHDDAFDDEEDHDEEDDGVADNDSNHNDEPLYYNDNEVPERIVYPRQGNTENREPEELPRVPSRPLSSLVFSDDHLAVCLATMTRLCVLELDNAAHLKSLKFLSVGSLSHTLEQLCLKNFRTRLPVQEIKHVFLLKQLQSLELRNAFDAHIGPVAEMLLQPSAQCSVLPCLDTFSHEWSKEH